MTHGIDFRNRGVLRTISTYYRVLRTILRGRLNSAQSCRDVYDDEQQLSTIKKNISNARFYNKKPLVTH